MPTKTCKVCKVDKNVDDFYTYKRSADGLRTMCKKCNNEKSRISHARNFLTSRASSLRWNNANKEKRKASQDAWRQRNWNKVLDNQKKRRQRLIGLVSIGGEFLSRALNDWGHRCAYCGTGLTMENIEWDHFIPLARRGGANAEHNLIPACRECNRRKNARDPFEFLHTIRSEGKTSATTAAPAPATAPASLAE